MAITLGQLQPVRECLIRMRATWLRLAGVRIGAGCRISLSSRLEPGRRGSITIGEMTQIAFKTHIDRVQPGGVT